MHRIPETTDLQATDPAVSRHHAIHPHNRHRSPKMRTFIDFAGEAHEAPR
jgi:DNA-binding transcriptional LysR family regulator